MDLSTKPIGSLIESADLAVADLGARGGVDEDLQALAWATTVIGFEPEPESAAQLTQAPSDPWKSIEVITSAVGDRIGRATLHIPRAPEGASLLPHNDKLVEEFGHESLHKTQRTLDVEVTTLNELKRLGQLRRFDYLKIDIEGAELDVLRQADDALRECVAIKVECSFLEQRVNQPYFFEVIQYLHEQNFHVVDAHDLHRWRRRNLPIHPHRSNFAMAYSRGRLAQADWILLRPAETCTDAAQALRLVLISAALGYFDNAISVFRRWPELQESAAAKFNVELEEALQDWSKASGRVAVKQATLRTLRKMVPLLRSVLGVMPHQEPNRRF